MSIFNVLYDFSGVLAKHDIDPAGAAVLLQRADFDRLRDAVSHENPSETGWNQGPAFSYAGITFLDGGAWVYAKAERSH